MSIHPAATALLASPHHRFTIRDTRGRQMRKLMTPGRFMAVRDQYLAEPSARVDVVDTRNGCAQTWDVSLSKYFGSK